MDSRPAVPGMVIDTGDVDAKLIIVRMRGAVHFTGGDMDLIERHFGKPLAELSSSEQTIAGAYIYLRRAGVDGASWEMATDDVAVEVVEAMDPTAGDTSTTSPPSAISGP